MSASKVKLTMAWPADLHAATADLAVRNRRSFTAEACVALDEHLARAGMTAECDRKTAFAQGRANASGTPLGAHGAKGGK